MLCYQDLAVTLFLTCRVPLLYAAKCDLLIKALGKCVMCTMCNMLYVSVQDLAVGADVDGLKVKDPMRTLLPVLLNPYSKHDKIRAVLLYIFSLNGISAFS